MGFPTDPFVKQNPVDKTDGSTTNQFLDAATASNWENEIADIGDQLKDGQFRTVQNSTGSILAKGKPVKISGHDGATAPRFPWRWR